MKNYGNKYENLKFSSMKMEVFEQKKTQQKKINGNLTGFSSNDFKMYEENVFNLRVLKRTLKFYCKIADILFL